MAKLEKEDALRVLQILLSNGFINNVNEVNEGSSLFTDISMDNLDKMEFIIALEHAFDININDTAADRCDTLGDVFEIIANIID